MTNTSLLEKEGPITLDDLKANFRANDFSAYSSGFGDKEESVERNAQYAMIRKHFKRVWYEQLKTMQSKALPYFSDVSPIGCLERSESSLVAGTVVNIMEDEQQTQMLLDIGLQVLQEPLGKELEQLAISQGKVPEELSEEELSAALDRLSDQFLGKMMNLLLQTQDVPQLLTFSSKMPAHEDFANGSMNDNAKIDFLRKWYHLRTKIGTMLSLSDVEADEHADVEDAMAAMDIQQRIKYDETYDALVAAFCATLDDDIDRQIVYMCDDGLTHAEMARRLGFQTHSAVTKRIQKIYEKCCAFLEAQPKD